ncbi:MAG: tRNA (N6-threonylcarbamoyladenosine(37)-N6)-methyltransferase TrmO [Acidobacteriota bacterium]
MWSPAKYGRLGHGRKRLMQGRLGERKGKIGGPRDSSGGLGTEGNRPVRSGCGPFWRVSPIGIIRTPFVRIESAPGSEGEPPTAEGQVEVFPDFEEGLQGIERNAHIWLLFVLHCKEGFDLTVRRRGSGPLTGLFSTRCPCRPNPIGITLVRLLGRSGRTLRVSGVDMVSGTPLLDIKPFAVTCDAPSRESKTPEVEEAREGAGEAGWGKDGSRRARGGRPSQEAPRGMS